MEANLENLNVLDPVLPPPFKVNANPFIYHLLNVRQVELRQRQVVARMENDNVTSTVNWLGRQHGMGRYRCLRERPR